MKIKVLVSIIFVLPLLIYSNEEKVDKQLNKIHANPFNDSYIIIFDGSPESFSIDKISIDRPKERTLKKIKFLTDEDAYAIKVFGKENKFIYTLGIGNPFYANYQHIGFEDRKYMGGPVSSAKIEVEENEKNTPRMNSREKPNNICLSMFLQYFFKLKYFG